MRPTSLSRRSVLALLGGAAVAATVPGCSLLPQRLDLARADLARNPADAEVPGSVSDGLLSFTGRWLAAAASDTIACSPLSAWLALAMVRIGARGATAEAMDAALDLPPGEELHQGANTLLQHLATRAGARRDGDRKGDIVLQIADQVFGQDGLTWTPELLDTLARSYGTGVARTDFATDPDGSLRRINRWVAGETDRKIPELLAPGSVKADTRLVLVNALRLVAPWAEKFTERPGEFHGDDGLSHPTMLARTFGGTGARGSDWIAARVPYLGDELAMTIVLPSPGIDLAARLEGGLLAEVFTSLHAGKLIELTLPRFETRSQLDLEPLLTELGMGAAFRSGADFSGLTPDASLAIDAVRHEGWISVDAEGTEAAAATAVVMGETSAQQPDEHLVVTCDRPFLYVVHDIATTAPIMAGRVGEPDA